MPDTPTWELRYRAPTRTLPTWSPRAPERLVFRSDEGGSYQAYAWDRSTGDVRRVTDERVGVLLASVSGDGSEIVWFSDPTGEESGRWLAMPFRGGRAREVLPGAPSGWPDGLALGAELAVGVIADRAGFGVYVSERGEAAKEIFRDVDLVSFSGTDEHSEGSDLVGLSPDGSLVCIEAANDGDSLHRRLVALDPRTGAVVGELADPPGRALLAFAWSKVPGDRRMLLAHELADRLRPAIWSPETGERVDLEVDLPGDVVPIDWWPDAASVLLRHRFRGRDRLYRFDLGRGTLTSIDHPVGEIHGARVRPDGRVWMRVSSADRAPELLADAADEILPAAPGGLRTGRPYREWLFRNGAGDLVHGWLATPSGDGPFPLYLKVHGGPDWLYMDTWFADVQSLVEEGFAVAMVNYRGSIGYGRAWRNHIVGNMGLPEVEDVVSGLDDLLARGVADPERVVIGGWSWGGYITLLALGRYPDRFTAGVAGAPVGDYAGSYDESAPSLQAWDRSLFGGVVTEMPDFVRERSPITYADRVRAPVLVLIAEHDTRCPPKQAHDYVDALRAAGGEAELYTYDEGHNSYVVDEEISEWRAVLEFLRRRIPLP
jgi:acetyl esterase/lipase